MTSKPFYQACENNKTCIAEVLGPYVEQAGYVLEIGSGTGQHGAYFSKRFPHLIWQSSDRQQNHAGILRWVNDAQRSNFLAPLEIDVNKAIWTLQPVEYVFSANTLHIMHWHEVKKFFEFTALALKQNGLLFVYGPFKYNGMFTSESNARFNDWLYSQGAHMAIRDFEKVNALASAHSFELIKDQQMPANNQLLIWQKATPTNCLS